ncbi:paralemmin-1 isoform X5 [Marmota flaviventris]|uniref:paralemmin-1 isoform X5 n=1 Tax=Marmota flaviventris TaxID=93162 RepID=UPI003A8B0F75
MGHNLYPFVHLQMPGALYPHSLSLVGAGLGEDPALAQCEPDRASAGRCGEGQVALGWQGPRGGCFSPAGAAPGHCREAEEAGGDRGQAPAAGGGQAAAAAPQVQGPAGTLAAGGDTFLGLRWGGHEEADAGGRAEGSAPGGLHLQAGKGNRCAGEWGAGPCPLERGQGSAQSSPDPGPKPSQGAAPGGVGVQPRTVVHALDGTAEDGVHPLSSSEVDELLHKADEAALSEAGSTAGAAEAGGPVEAIRSTPARREIPGVQAQPGEATSGPPGTQPGQEPPVTMIFMGYQNVEDEAETKKVLGLQDAITAELVVIEDAAETKEPAPPNGSAAEPPGAAGSREEDQVGPEATTSDPQDLDVKKQRCKCCSIM